MRTHSPVDDKQLWRTVEDNGRIWPVYATPSTADGPCYFVELALPAETSDQWKFVSHWLNSVSFDSDGTHWLARKTNFEQLCLKCHGVTPGFYLKWPNLLCSKNEVSSKIETLDEPPEKESESDNFIRFCCAENGWTDFPHINARFTLICKSAVRWLLINHKPVDLQFAKLYAVPFRGNWKEMVRRRWPNIGGILRRKKHRMGILEASGVIPSLHDSELTEMPTDSTFGWSLEVVAKKPFDKFVEDVETETLLKSNPARYVMRLGRQIQKFYVQIVEILAYYYAKESRQAGKVDSSGARHTWVLHPKVSSYRPRPIKRESVEDDAAVAPITPAAQPSGDIRTYASPPQEVPPVPNAGSI